MNVLIINRNANTPPQHHVQNVTEEHFSIIITCVWIDFQLSSNNITSLKYNNGQMNMKTRPLDNVGSIWVCLFFYFSLFKSLHPPHETSIKVEKTRHTIMYTHANTHMHAHSFSVSDDTYVCGFFHGTVSYTPPPHQQGRRKTPQDGMSAKAWEKEEKLGLFPQAFTTKTPALRHGTPLGGADTCPKTQVQIHTTCF